MSETKKICDEISVAGQLTPTQLQQTATDGFKSVMNLRSAQEEGFLDSEAQQVESVGLEYSNIPLKPSEINEELATEIWQKIDALPKPLLIHCASGVRAGFMALIYIAVRDRLSLEEVYGLAEELRFDLNINPILKEFALNYIDRHSSAK